MPWSKLRAPRSSANGDAQNSPVDDFVKQVAELARDLVTLEVNTIVKSNMTAERMPSVPNALLDIARDYIRAFAVMRANVNSVFSQPEGTKDWREVPVELVPLDAAAVNAFELPDEFKLGWLFERIRWSAKNTRYAFIKRNLPTSEEDIFLLGRIENNSDTLRTLLDRYEKLRDTPLSVEVLKTNQDIFHPPLRMTARDVLIVRKMWEIGTEQVVVQTAVQLDGDVVTRVARHLTNDRERSEQVLAVHQQGVQTAVGNWKAIINAAVAVVGGITGQGIEKRQP